MNKDNYCSLGISQNLVAAGIILETDLYWWEYDGQWEIIGYRKNDAIPAPMWAELWRELPDQLNNHEVLRLSKNCRWTYAGYMGVSHALVMFKNVNPTDVLAKLLIWLRGQKISTYEQKALNNLDELTNSPEYDKMLKNYYTENI